MKPKILNIDQVKFLEWSGGDRFGYEIAPVGVEMESQKLGFNITVLPPGKRAFPYHAHRGNEEMFFVLEGEGSARLDGEVHKIRKGDFISVPPGRQSGHQIINDSNAPLRYLAVSTMELPEVVEYPDSEKIGIIAGTLGRRPTTEETLRHFTRVADGVDYWDGEK